LIFGVGVPQALKKLQKIETWGGGGCHSKIEKQLLFSSTVQSSTSLIWSFVDTKFLA